MECNKEEAARALDMAEAKLQTRDIEGARRLAQKAQRLFPSLPRIPQMIALLDVLIAAAPGRISGGAEPDWYAVLGVPDPSAPLAFMKKQYRSMALLLHPDKNASRSADEGFKLVAQAWAVLSNASLRSAYDARRANSRRNLTCHSSQTPPPPKSDGGGGDDTCAVVFATTLCPHCRRITKVVEQLIGNLILCKHCEKFFLAIEHNPDHASSVRRESDGPLPKNTKSSLPNRTKDGGTEGGRYKQNVSQRHGNDENGELKENVKQKDGSDGGKEFEENAKQKDDGNRGRKRKENTKKKDGRKLEENARQVRRKEDNLGQHEGIKESRTSTKKRPRCDIQREKAAENAVPKKRVKKNEHTECKKSAESDMPARATKASSDNRSENSTGNAASTRDNQWQSSTGDGAPTRKRKVDCDGQCKQSPENAAPTRPRGVHWDIEHEQRERSAGQKKPLDDGWHGKSAEDTTPARGTGPSGEGCSRIPAENTPIRKRTREKERIDYSESRRRKKSYTSTKMGKITVPDADFCSFDEVSADQLEQGQVWALYDDDDQMPRFYAYVQHIYSKSPFKVKIQWLEAKNDESQAIADWIDAGFYLGCGEFKHGDIKTVNSLESFSHQILYWENTVDGNFRVMPGKGEVWALYKEWNASWNGSEPLEVVHAYEFVEIATEFDAASGFEVIPLTKLKNYVSVFRREKRTKVVPVNEKLRFSHSVPFKELSGDEDRRLPTNCLQLDTGALGNEKS